MNSYEIKNLAEFLENSKEEIDLVILRYMWAGDYYAELTRNYILDENGVKCYLYAVFTYSYMDEEYNFAGNVKKAIEFAKDYGVFDGQSFRYDHEDHILSCELEGSDPDAERYFDSFLPDNATDIEYIGLCARKNERFIPWDILAKEKHRDGEESGDDEE